MWGHQSQISSTWSTALFGGGGSRKSLWFTRGGWVRFCLAKWIRVTIFTFPKAAIYLIHVKSNSSYTHELHGNLVFNKRTITTKLAQNNLGLFGKMHKSNTSMDTVPPAPAWQGCGSTGRSQTHQRHRETSASDSPKSPACP